MTFCSIACFGHLNYIVCYFTCCYVSINLAIQISVLQSCSGLFCQCMQDPDSVLLPPNFACCRYMAHFHFKLECENILFYQIISETNQDLRGSCFILVHSDVSLTHCCSKAHQICYFYRSSFSFSTIF